MPDLAGPLGNGIHGQVLVGSAASFVSAYLAVRFLTRYFRTGTLRPFAWYSLGRRRRVVRLAGRAMTRTCATAR